jgi:hypothetical protein
MLYSSGLGVYHYCVKIFSLLMSIQYYRQRIAYIWDDTN